MYDFLQIARQTVFYEFKILQTKSNHIIVKTMQINVIRCDLDDFCNVSFFFNTPNLI